LDFVSAQSLHGSSPHIRVARLRALFRSTDQLHVVACDFNAYYVAHHRGAILRVVLETSLLSVRILAHGGRIRAIAIGTIGTMAPTLATRAGVATLARMTQARTSSATGTKIRLRAILAVLGAGVLILAALNTTSQTILVGSSNKGAVHASTIG
jgi:hypothetical protein